MLKFEFSVWRDLPKTVGLSLISVRRGFFGAFGGKGKLTVND